MGIGEILDGKGKNMKKKPEKRQNHGNALGQKGRDVQRWKGAERWKGTERWKGAEKRKVRNAETW